MLIAFGEDLNRTCNAEEDIKPVFRVAQKDILKYSFNCNHYCGEWPNRTKKKSLAKKALRLRIVGGRKVINPRPWMAFIEMRNSEGNVLVSPAFCPFLYIYFFMSTSL